MKLFDTDVAIDIMKTWKKYSNESGKDGRLIAMGIGICIGLLNDAPIIDIVQCSECKYESRCSHSVQHTAHDAHSVTIGYKSINFCSCGERKE